MREIKLRSWNGEKMQPCVSLEMLAKSNCKVFKEHFDVFTWLLYIGKNDVNNNEIYDGDIVKWKNPEDDSYEVFTVEWFGSGYILRDIKGKVEEIGNTADLEVIGNQFEHSYLLNIKY